MDAENDAVEQKAIEKTARNAASASEMERPRTETDEKHFTRAKRAGRSGASDASTLRLDPIGTCQRCESCEF